VLVATDGKYIEPDDIVMSGKDYFAAGGRERRKTEVETPQLNTLDLMEVEKSTILRALDISKWIQKDAAKLLNISPRALNYKIKYHTITHPNWKKNI